MDINALTKKQLIGQVMTLQAELGKLQKQKSDTIKKSAGQIAYDSEMFNKFYENLPNMVFTLKPNGDILWVNKLGAKSLGYTKTELIGQPVWKVVHADYLDDVKSKISAIIKNKKKDSELGFCKVKKDGSILYVHEKAQLIFSSDGTIDHIRIICRDITKIKIAEAALLKEEEKYRTITNHLNVGIYRSTIDENGKLLDFNSAFMRIFGYKNPLELFDVPVLSLYLNHHDRRSLLNTIEKKGSIKNKEVLLVKKDGTRFLGSITAVLSKDKAGKVIYYEGIVEDITDRKNAEKILQESEEKYRKIFNAFPDIYFRADMNGIIEEISPSVQKITGFLPNEIIGMDARQFYRSGEDWDKIGKLLYYTGKVQDFDTEIKSKKDKTICCSLTASVILDKNENITGIGGVLRDISDRKKAENKLSESQRRLSTLMGNLPGMAYRCKNDKDRTMDFVSEGCKDLTGHKSSELIKNSKISFNDLIHPDDQSIVWDIIQKGVLKHDSYKLVYRLIAKDGKLKWVWEQGTGIYSDDGELLALEGFITNISEQKLAEEEIRKLSRAVEQSPTIVVITNLKGTIEYVNPKFSVVTGYTPEEVINKNPRILKSGKTPDETYIALWQTISSGKDWFGEFINKKKNGEYYWESANIYPLKDEKGRITHFIAMKEDITVRKTMEQDLIKAKEKAEESDKLKSAFLANMSHEIRTPMNAIIGFSQLLSEPDITPQEQSHYISLIQKSGGDLLELIDDIIDISKIEAGQLKVFKSDYFVETILTELYESNIEYLKTTDSGKDISFKYKRTERLKKVVIHTDIDKLKQVLRNLINNALKFTDFGLVEFGAEVKNDGLNSSIQFYVRDTGIGMPNDKLDVIFESFRQLDVTSKKLYGGTGLGLAITKKIVELLGGNIWVNSTQGQGSTFYFTLPYNPILVKTESKNDIPNLTGIINYNWADKQILIVEDDDQSFLFYQSVLKKTHVKISRATNGNDAIDQFHKQNFDLVLMDIRMPEMDGCATTESILLHNPMAKIIAQTAYAVAGEKQRCLDAGCVDYFTKPIKIAGFLQIIEKYI